MFWSMKWHWKEFKILHNLVPRFYFDPLILPGTILTPSLDPISFIWGIRVARSIVIKKQEMIVCLLPCLRLVAVTRATFKFALKTNRHRLLLACLVEYFGWLVLVLCCGRENGKLNSDVINFSVQHSFSGASFFKSNWSHTAPPQERGKLPI